MKDTLALNYFKQETEWLIELGFIALLKGYFTAAEKIFTAASIALEGDTVGYLGLALINISQGDTAQAIITLEKVLAEPKKTVNKHEVQKLLFLAYMLSGDAKKAENLHGKFILDSCNQGKEYNLEKASSFLNHEFLV